MPVRIIGWDAMPEVGNTFQAYDDRAFALEEVEKEKIIQQEQKGKPQNKKDNDEAVGTQMFTLVVKADTGSSLEAILYEIKKLEKENILPQVISSGIGTISENDIRLANGERKAIVLGFNVKVDSPAKSLAERNEIEIKVFDIIYKLTEWLDGELVKNKPKVKVEESLGEAKILKIFSKVKDKQILGGRVLVGSIKVGAQLKIVRRGEEIGQGRIRELQQQKNKTDEVKENTEFGAMIEAKMEIAPGDMINSFIIVEK
jgi:translation initiation factor IF-2